MESPNKFPTKLEGDVISEPMRRLDAKSISAKDPTKMYGRMGWTQKILIFWSALTTFDSLITLFIVLIFAFLQLVCIAGYLD
jgi:hypothetical protein